MEENKTPRDDETITLKIDKDFLKITITCAIIAFFLTAMITLGIGVATKYNNNTNAGAADFWTAITKDAPTCRVREEIDFEQLTTITIDVSCKDDYKCIVVTINLIGENNKSFTKHNIAKLDCEKDNSYKLNHTFTLEEIVRAKDVRCYISYYH